MINATLNYLRTIDDELFNRVRAFGPGDGINRVSVTVSDSASIAKYGVRETTQDFPEATSRADLASKAQAYLDEHKEPVTDIEVSFYFDTSNAELEPLTFNGEALTYGGETLNYWVYGGGPEVRRGDTIRIVSQDLGLNTTGVIQELDWEPGVVTLSIGRKNYNLLDVINGEAREEEQRENSLGLPVPIGFSAQTAYPGVRVRVNPYTNSRATGVEIHASVSNGFTPDRSTLVVRGAGTVFDLDLTGVGVRYYFKARSYDQAGGFSEYTDQVTALAGGIDGGIIDPGSLDITPFASELRPPRNVSSLPLVPSALYEVGDLVVFGGELYELVSETGVPATDWSLMDAVSLASKTVAHQIVAGQIIAGAIGADEIAANAITAGKIAAGEVTASKLDIDGTVTVANDNTGQDGAFVVLNSSSQEILRLGAGISGKSGVPSGIDYGLWGALGTGVFVAGAPRVLASGFVEVSETFSSNITAGSTGSWGGYASPVIPSLTVPTGKKVLVMVIPAQGSFSPGGPGDLLWNGGVTTRAGRDGTTSTTQYVLTAGSYTNIKVGGGIGVYNPTGSTINWWYAMARLFYLIVEVDA